MVFSRLIHFESDDGNSFYGEPEIDNVAQLQERLDSNNLFARPLTGSSIFNLSGSPEGSSSKRVTKLLGVLLPADVPLIKCVGLNYITHIREGGRKPPPYPSIFIKPRACIAAFNADIPVPKIAQHEQCDYEGELAIVIGKTGKDITAADALDYVFGYVASNDISARTWQKDPAFAGGVPQWCFSKGFDQYGPLGPMIVSPKVVGDAGSLDLKTWVNGELRQSSNTSDLLFGVRDIVAFVSQGTTLEQGTVIMTGTPAGVAMGMKPEPRWLKDGDVVKVAIEGLGACQNKMVFQ